MAREEYSDPTSEAVTRIETQVDEIEILVQEIKNTDLANLEANMYNPLNYEPFSYGYNSGALVATETEILNIQGEGYLEDAFAVISNYTKVLTMNVYVDGVRIWRSSYSTQDEIHGIMNAKNMVGSDLNTPYVFKGLLKNDSDVVNNNVYVRSLSQGTLPATETSGSPKVMVISDKIKFNTSLVVTIVKNSSTGTVLAKFNGGIKS